MAKYIKLEELMRFPIRRNHYDKEHGSKDFIYGIETVLEYAENLPAADVAPVRHGRWEEMHYEGGILDGTNFDRCSVCGYERVFDDPALKTVFKYCPNCGAKMDEVIE